MDRDSILCEMNNSVMQMTADDLHSLYRLKSIEDNKMKVPPQFIDILMANKSYHSYFNCEPLQVASCVVYICTFESINQFFKEHPDAGKGDQIQLQTSIAMFVQRFLEIVWDKILVDIPRLMLFSSVITELHQMAFLQKIDKHIQSHMNLLLFRDDSILETSVKALEESVIKLINGEQMAGIVVDGDSGRSFELPLGSVDSVTGIIDNIEKMDIPDTMKRILDKIKKLRLDDKQRDDPDK